MPRSDEAAQPSAPRRYARAFGHFWWEFLVGDTPELLVGAVIAIGIVALLAHQGAARVLTVGALPVIVIVMLAVSVRRAQRAQLVQRADGQPRRSPES